MKKLALYSALLSGCVLLFGQGLQGAANPAPGAPTLTPQQELQLANHKKQLEKFLGDFELCSNQVAVFSRSAGRVAATTLTLPAAAAGKKDAEDKAFKPEDMRPPIGIPLRDGDIPDEVYTGVEYDPQAWGWNDWEGYRKQNIAIKRPKLAGKSEKEIMLQKFIALDEIVQKITNLDIDSTSLKDDAKRAAIAKEITRANVAVNSLVGTMLTNNAASNTEAFGLHNVTTRSDNGSKYSGTEILFFKSPAARKPESAQYYIDIFLAYQHWINHLNEILGKIRKEQTDINAIIMDPAKAAQRREDMANLAVLNAQRDADIAHKQGLDALANAGHARTLEDLRVRDEAAAKRAKEAQDLTALQGKHAMAQKALDSKTAKQLQADQSAAALAQAKIKAVSDRQAAKTQADAAVQAAKGVADINAKNQQKALNKALVGIPAGAIGVILAYYAFKNFYTPKPTIIEDGDTSMLTWTERLMGKKLPPSRFHELILSPEMWDIVKDKFEGIEKVVDLNKSKGGKHHGKLSNMMFWGPAGTGKTMAAENYCRFLAGKGKIDFIVIRGGVFKALGSAGAAQEALKAIFRFADKNYKATGRPTIFVFDEADSMLCKRNDASLRTEITVEIVNTFLSMFPRAVDEAKMFIICTNYPDRIDHAVLSRIPTSNRVEFGAPGRAEVRKMLEQYMDSALTKEGFGISPDVRNNYDQIADRMLKAGFVGRDIDAFAGQLVFPMVNQHLQEVTMPVLNKVLDQSTKQQNLSVY